MRNDKAYKDVMRCRKTQKTRVLANTGRKTKECNQRLVTEPIPGNADITELSDVSKPDLMPTCCLPIAAQGYG